MPSTDSRCRDYGCDQPATREIEMPALAPGLDLLKLPYCDKHAELVLAEPTVFSGAREVTA